MSADSKIEWTDATWNPVTGCTEVSPGCDHCYAKTFAERWRGTPGHHFEQGFDVTLRPERLDQPLRWKKPRRIFVNSMSDLFHDQVPGEFIAQVFAAMALAPQHTFQLLTKRHGRMRALLSSERFIDLVTDAVLERSPAGLDPVPIELRERWWPLPNVWLGVSVENQQWANIRIPALLDTPATVRFLSCEPLLGPVSLFANSRIDTGTLVDWVIVGGESGPGARPMHPAWARSLREECTAYGIPFLFKQWGAWRHAAEFDDVTIERQAIAEGWWERWPNVSAHSVWPDGHHSNVETPEPGVTATMQRVGKTAAGRVLDGRTWDEFPQGVTVDA